MRIAILTALAACAIAAPAQGHDTVALGRAVFVERTGHTGDGRIERRIEPASRLARGDKVVLMVEWRGKPDGKGFAVTSPVPRALSFQDASQEGVEVSVDGGRSWGRIGQIRLRDGAGIRFATPEDVTHLRWRIGPREAALGSGRLTYSAIVR